MTDSPPARAAVLEERWAQVPNPDAWISCYWSWLVAIRDGLLEYFRRSIERSWLRTERLAGRRGVRRYFSPGRWLEGSARRSGERSVLPSSVDQKGGPTTWDTSALCWPTIVLSDSRSASNGVKAVRRLTPMIHQCLLLHSPSRHQVLAMVRRLSRSRHVRFGNLRGSSMTAPHKYTTGSGNCR